MQEKRGQNQKAGVSKATGCSYKSAIN